MSCSWNFLKSNTNDQICFSESENKAHNRLNFSGSSVTWKRVQGSTCVNTISWLSSEIGEGRGAVFSKLALTRMHFTSSPKWPNHFKRLDWDVGGTLNCVGALCGVQILQQPSFTLYQIQLVQALLYLSCIRGRTFFITFLRFSPPSCLPSTTFFLAMKTSSSFFLGRCNGRKRARQRRRMHKFSFYITSIHPLEGERGKKAHFHRLKVSPRLIRA